MKLGLIAGNGRFPFLLLDAARAQGLAVVVAAIREETDPEIDRRAAADNGITVHWLSLGELSRLIETLPQGRRREGRDGRPGEAQADFFQHPARLAAGQAAAESARAQYRHAAGRGGQGAGAMRALN